MIQKLLRLKGLWIILVCFFLLLFAYRSLLTHISTNLSDWYDYPFIVWNMYQHVDHFSHGQILHGFFDTNIYYPDRQTLLFSELLLPIGIAGYFLHFFSNNPILVFNIILFTTLLLNIIAAYFMWKQIFRNSWQQFFAVLTTTLSPFVFINSVHFQILSLWIFFICLGLLFTRNYSLKRAIILGLCLTLQFLMSVYLCIFFIFALVLWIGYHFLIEKKNRRLLLQYLGVTGVVFLLTCGFFIFKYLQVQHLYGIYRAYWEYVYYSADITDYLYTGVYKSLLSGFFLISKWNATDLHVGQTVGFVTFALLIPTLFAIVRFRSTRKNISFQLHFDELGSLFALFIAIGFIFSLGPRLHVNGSYTSFILPYELMLKFNPIVSPIRANWRWSIFLYLGFTYFATVGIEKISSRGKKMGLLVIALCILFLIEVFPLHKPSESKQYYSAVDANILAPVCSTTPKVVLEYPMEEFKKDANIYDNLTYRTQMMLASVKHHCLLINGYMGYSPKDYDQYEAGIIASVEQKDQKEFLKYLHDRNVYFFKLNKSQLYDDRTALITKWLADSNITHIVYNDNTTLVAVVQQ